MGLRGLFRAFGCPEIGVIHSLWWLTGDFNHCFPGPSLLLWNGEPLPGLWIVGSKASGGLLIWRRLSCRTFLAFPCGFCFQVAFGQVKICLKFSKSPTGFWLLSALKRGFLKPSVKHQARCTTLQRCLGSSDMTRGHREVQCSWCGFDLRQGRSSMIQLDLRLSTS